jgi:AbrB family looped-hinge helix DNA binding protein
MALPQSKLTAEGRTSVPAEIRRELGLEPGSALGWDQQGDTVVVRRVGRYSSEDIHRALFQTRPKPRKLEELEQAVRRHVRNKQARD